VSKSPTAVVGIVDVHVHGGPSLTPRHGLDPAIVAENLKVGISLTVLKAHEGSTVERATLCGGGAIGGVVLNSPVGGANAEAVEVAGRLGGRLVWLPTVSSSTHHAHMSGSELAVINSIDFDVVRVVENGTLIPEWHDVLDVVAAQDMVLGSGHLSCADTLVVFKEARRRGVHRLLVNHPMMSFLGWEDGMESEFQALEAFLELGIIPDLLTEGDGRRSLSLLDVYPDELLVFGSDQGHASCPRISEVLPAWVDALVERIGLARATAILCTSGRDLVGVKDDGRAAERLTLAQ
jgi:hypothetical protein